MHRFGDELDLEKEVGRALEDLERGERPDPADMAALLMQLVVRKDPQMVRKLSAILDHPAEEVLGQTQSLEEGDSSRVEQEGRSADEPA